jgi:hypothetical protein
MLYAGLRPQECKALKIDRDVDFENDVITVRQTAHVDGQKYEFTADMKTDWSSQAGSVVPAAKRGLKMPQRLCYYIRARKTGHAFNLAGGLG